MENNILNIIISKSLTEDKIEKIKKNFTDYNIQDKIKKNTNIKKITFDLSNIKEIDFFGYQILYAYFDYIKSDLKFENISVINKSNEFISFESKMGLNID